MPTKIEWTDETWNPVTGCTKISEGCAHCYAERMAKRLRGRFGYPENDPFRVTLHPDRLEDPLRWRKPRRVFVCSMSDLFHDSIPEAFIWRVIEVCWKAKGHTFQILTKRPERALDVLTRSAWWNNDTPQNIWLGITAENNRRWLERRDMFFWIPAAVHFVSIEPMLEAIFFSDDDLADIDWIICGGETGPGARPMHPDWIRSLRDQCEEAYVPFFFKQWGEWKAISGACPAEVIEFQERSKGRACQIEGSPLVLWRIGKKAAGRILDGRTWDELPT